MKISSGLSIYATQMVDKGGGHFLPVHFIPGHIVPGHFVPRLGHFVPKLKKFDELYSYLEALEVNSFKFKVTSKSKMPSETQFVDCLPLLTFVKK